MLHEELGLREPVARLMPRTNCPRPASLGQCSEMSPEIPVAVCQCVAVNEGSTALRPCFPQIIAGLCFGMYFCSPYATAIHSLLPLWSVAPSPLGRQSHDVSGSSKLQ